MCCFSLFCKSRFLFLSFRFRKWLPQKAVKWLLRWFLRFFIKMSTNDGNFYTMSVETNSFDRLPCLSIFSMHEAQSG